MEQKQIELLKEKAKKIRLNTVKSLGIAGSGHPGGALSIVDILIVLYFHSMRIDPKNPKWPDRDRFVLSKGHAAPALYATLAEAGYFPQEELWTLRKFGSILQGHPDLRKTPGVEMSTGSLGQGLSASNGMAIAGKLDKRDYRVYVALGDGECQEGQVWEAAMTSTHMRLDNLTAFIDYNGLQIDGNIEDVKSLKNIPDRFRSFGWNVVEIPGHDIQAIDNAIGLAKATKGRPTLVVAHTLKGKGISFMEGVADWHGRAPNEEETRQAVAELGGKEYE